MTIADVSEIMDWLRVLCIARWLLLLVAVTLIVTLPTSSLNVTFQPYRNWESFRHHYHRFDRTIHEILAVLTDSVILARLGDDIDEYTAIVNEVHYHILLLNQIQELISHSMHMILSLWSFKPFKPILLSCDRTSGFSTSRHWQNLIMEGVMIPGKYISKL